MLAIGEFTVDTASVAQYGWKRCQMCHSPWCFSCNFCVLNAFGSCICNGEVMMSRLKGQSTDFNIIQLLKTHRHLFLFWLNKDSIILAVLFGKIAFSFHNRNELDVAYPRCIKRNFETEKLPCWLLHSKKIQIFTTLHSCLYNTEHPHCHEALQCLTVSWYTSQRGCADAVFFIGRWFL